MNKNKKFLLLFLAIVIVLIVVIVFIDFQRKEEKTLIFNDFTEEGLMFETSFEEREVIIKNLLSKKYQDNKEIEVFIAREEESHINGLFFINNYNNQEVFRGKFFAIVDKNIEIVWSGDGQIDCSILNSYSFPQEMAPDCF